MESKFKFQQGLTGEGEQFEEGRDYSKRLQDLGRSLISGLYMLVRNVKLYAPDNVIFDRPLDQLVECINTLIAMEGSLSLQCAGESFYLNNMLLRVDLKSAANIRQLACAFEEHDLGGFNLEQQVNQAELRRFMHIFVAERAEQAGERGVSAHKLQALKLRRFEKLQQILERQQQDDAASQTDKSLDRKRYGLVVYARTVVFMRNFFAGLRGEAPELPMGKCVHLIQDLVDVCHEQRSHFLGVTTVDKGEAYLAFHSVNVALLAIVFGAELGLDKARLRELGIAALFHDIGKVDLPAELVEKGGRLTPHEKRQLVRSPLLGVMRLLRANRLDARNVQCILAAFHQATDWGRPVKDARGQVHHVAQQADLGAYERVIAIVDAYDRLVFQQSLNPDLAVAVMNSDLVHRFDPELLRIFSHLMKGYTSRILSETGEKMELF